MKIVTKQIESMGVSINYTVGKNDQDNDDIIDSAKPNDIWFHLGDASSAHVIANIPDDLILNKKQLKLIIIQGAVVCKEVSKYKSQSNVRVVYTKIKNIVKTETPGRVIMVDAKELII